MDAFAGIVLFRRARTPQALADEARNMIRHLAARIERSAPKIRTRADARAAVAFVAHPDRPLVTLVEAGTSTSETQTTGGLPPSARWTVWLGAAAGSGAVPIDPLNADQDTHGLWLTAGSDFACVAWNGETRTLLLARDPLGYRTIWIYRMADGYAFASDLAALYAHPAFRPRLGPGGLNALLALGPYRPPESGILEDMSAVRPGTVLRLTPTGQTTTVYWSLPLAGIADTGNDPAGANLDLVNGAMTDIRAIAALVRERLTEAVRSCAGSEQPAAFLSGGIDSSAIVALLTRQGFGPVRTYSLEYEDNDRYFAADALTPERDAAFIGEMVRFAGSRHTVVTLRVDALVDVLKTALWARGVPGMVDIDGALLLFSSVVAKTERLVLSGEGADELFGGYPWFFDETALRLATYPWSRQLERRLSYLTKEARRRLQPEVFVQATWHQALAEIAPPHFRPPLTPFSARDARTAGIPAESAAGSFETTMRIMAYVNLTRWAGVLLERKDRMTRLFGLDARLPFIDRALVETVWPLPWAVKAVGPAPKGLLREALQDLLPDAVRLRKKNPFPKTFHPRYIARIQAMARNRLQDPSTPLFEWIDRTAFTRTVETLSGGEPFPWFGQLLGAPQFVAYLLTVDEWLRALDPKIV